MAWTTPLTAVANSALTAAQWNASVRDNLNATAPAQATQSGSYFVGSGVNSIAERRIEEDYIAGLETTTSTSYANLATPGPAVSLTTGGTALVLVSVDVRSSTAGQFARASVDVSGATTAAAEDGRCLKFGSPGSNDSIQASFVSQFTLTPGTNTFTVKYRTSLGSSTASFADRRIIVMAF